jgi:hypothetical protein
MDEIMSSVQPYVAVESQRSESIEGSSLHHTCRPMHESRTVHNWKETITQIQNEVQWAPSVSRDGHCPTSVKTFSLYIAHTSAAQQHMPQLSLVMADEGYNPTALAPNWDFGPKVWGIQ